MRRLGLLLALLAPLLLLSPASAATVEVQLTVQGPSPAAVTLSVGDTVRFVNGDTRTHDVAFGAGFSFTRSVPAGGTVTTPAFTRGGTFSYTDSYTVLAVPQQADGSVTVRAPAASATPTASPSAKPTASPTAAPSRSPAASPTAVPSPSGTGTAVVPGLEPGAVPTATPTPSALPAPDLASPSPSASAGPVVLYGDKRAVVQDSPHRYGLPAALAVVAIVGLVSLLVRFLLAQGPRV